MQLKRDTDYAIRILFCLNENAAGSNGQTKGLTLPELAAQSRIPKAAAGRICRCLREKGLIRRSSGQEDDETASFSSVCLLNYSLLDVIEAVEGTGQIFAVFDRKTPMYRSCEKRIVQIENRFAHLLAGISMESLLGEDKEK